MPPKRRTTAAQPSSASAAPPPKRRSALAREHSLSASQESEIREAFSLFAVTHPEYDDGATHGMGVLRRADVRRCLVALGLRVAPADVPAMLETLDPEEEGFVAFPHFVAYAAILMHAREAGEEEDGGGDDGGEGGFEGGRAGVRRAEVREAYRLFTGTGQGPIKVEHLRRVARELREDVPDEVLWDMITEANGERRTKEGVGKGVSIEEFEQVMKRAGVFG